MKLDVEGAELGVLRDLASAGRFADVDRIMEFHGFPGNPLSEVLRIFEGAGHHYAITRWHRDASDPTVSLCVIATERA